jgi:hypothetical protein
MYTKKDEQATKLLLTVLLHYRVPKDQNLRFKLSFCIYNTAIFSLIQIASLGYIEISVLISVELITSNVAEVWILSECLFKMWKTRGS